MFLLLYYWELLRVHPFAQRSSRTPRLVVQRSTVEIPASYVSYLFHCFCRYTMVLRAIEAVYCLVLPLETYFIAAHLYLSSYTDLVEFSRKPNGEGDFNFASFCPEQNPDGHSCIYIEGD